MVLSWITYGTLPPFFRGRSELICTPSPSLWAGVRFGIQSRSPPSSSFCVRKDPENFLFLPPKSFLAEDGYCEARRKEEEEKRGEGIPFKRMSRRMTSGKMIFFRVACCDMNTELCAKGIFVEVTVIHPRQFYLNFSALLGNVSAGSETINASCSVESLEP